MFKLFLNNRCQQNNDKDGLNFIIIFFLNLVINNELKAEIGGVNVFFKQFKMK